MPDRTLYQWFAESVARVPEELALEVHEHRLTYRTLHDCATAIAARMLTAHGRAPQRVALLAARSVVAFAGYLAALRLGAAVTPLNPGFPVPRNRHVCELAGIDLVLADTSGMPQLDAGLLGDTEPAGDAGPAGDTATVLRLTDDEVLAGARSADPAALPGYSGALDDIAYVLFTSGSTGRPKGVPIRHRNVSPYLAHNIERFKVGPGARLSHTFDLTFDPSVFDLFVTWGGGGTLVCPQRAELLTPVDYLVNRGITHWFSVPSVVSVSAELGNLPTGLVTALRHSIFIGERLTVGQAAAWHAVAADSLIDNVYGPTELTVACTEYRLPRDPAQWPATSNDTVPIGPVYGFLDHVIVDEDGRLAREGELCVRGAQRFDGYLDEHDNRGRFLAHDGVTATGYDGTGERTAEHYYRTGDRVRIESGHLVHLGRLDNQVKIRGYRVELGEIEAVLGRYPGLSQAVVVAVPREADIELVGCYTGTPLAPAELVRWLRRQLPIHMVPRRFEYLERVPFNANGKVDRGALRHLVSAHTPA